LNTQSFVIPIDTSYRTKLARFVSTTHRELERSRNERRVCERDKS